MSEMRRCPWCHWDETHEVADDGTIITWAVTWIGDEAVVLVLVSRRKQYLSDERHRRLKELRAKYPERVKWEEPDEKSKEVGFISNRSNGFLHYREAVNEYNWIRGILVKRGDWEVQQAHLTLTEGERASWDDLFGENAVWMA